MFPRTRSPSPPIQQDTSARPEARSRSPDIPDGAAETNLEKSDAQNDRSGPIRTANSKDRNAFPWDRTNSDDVRRSERTTKKIESYAESDLWKKVNATLDDNKSRKPNKKAKVSSAAGRRGQMVTAKKVTMPHNRRKKSTVESSTTETPSPKETTESTSKRKKRLVESSDENVDQSKRGTQTKKTKSILKQQPIENSSEDEYFDPVAPKKAKTSKLKGTKSKAPASKKLNPQTKQPKEKMKAAATREVIMNPQTVDENEQAPDTKTREQAMILAAMDDISDYQHRICPIPESAIRSTLDHDVDDDVFSAALILNRISGAIPFDPETESEDEDTNVLHDEALIAAEPSYSGSTVDTGKREIPNIGKCPGSDEAIREFHPENNPASRTPLRTPKPESPTFDDSDIFPISRYATVSVEPAMHPTYYPVETFSRNLDQIRRSQRHKTPIAEETDATSTPQEPTHSLLSKPPNLDTSGFMPSKANNYQFEYDSPSGRTATELNKLFKIPARPKVFPQDLKSKKAFGMTMSYTYLGSKPKPNLAQTAVADMEEEDRLRKEELEEAMQQEDKWNDLWGVMEWEE